MLSMRAVTEVVLVVAAASSVLSPMPDVEPASAEAARVKAVAFRSVSFVEISSAGSVGISSPPPGEDAAAHRRAFTRR